MNWLPAFSLAVLVFTAIAITGGWLIGRVATWIGRHAGKWWAIPAAAVLILGGGALLVLAAWVPAHWVYLATGGRS